jgi:hypothetical protein
MNEPTCAIETITPEQAREYLSNKNPNNRKIRESLWRQYAADMAAGKWRLNGQPLIFDKDGNLLDGQHRMEGCVFANVPFQTFVHRNVEADVFYTIDAGAKRTSADHLHRAGLENARVIATAARLLWKYHQGVLQKTATHPSVTEVQETGLKHGRELNDAFTYIKGLALLKKLMPQATATFCFAVFARKDRQKAITFFDRLATGETTDPKHDPIALLRNRFIGGTRKNALAYLFKAWVCFRDDVGIGRLVVAEGESWADLNRSLKKPIEQVSEAA